MREKTPQIMYLISLYFLEKKNLWKKKKKIFEKKKKKKNKENQDTGSILVLLQCS